MPAIVAMRFNPDLKRHAKLPPATAIVRKLIVLANAFMREVRGGRHLSLTKTDSLPINRQIS